MSTTISYASTVKLTDEETLVTLPVEAGDDRIRAAGEVCAKIVWPLEHEVAGVECVRIRPNGLDVHISGELNQTYVEAEIFRVLGWVLGESNVARATLTTDGFAVGSEWWYRNGDTIFIEGPDGLTEEL